ncbi:MAG: helix-turn-helix domain-containing protein [Phycisphaerae bacterium]|nr:helix-turn-helix domain-containing protein [Phycisphaerae bacterium]
MKSSVPSYPGGHYFPPGQIPLRIHPPQRHRQTELHSHGFTELVVIQAGRVVHVTEEEEYPVEAGDVFVIHEGDAHAYREGKKLILWNILYDSRRLLTSADAVRKIPGYHAMFHIEPRFRRRHGPRARLRLNPHDLDRALELIAAIKKELENQAAGYELLATALFLQLVGFLSRSYSRDQNTTSTSLLRMGDVISFIEEHYDRPIGLGQLAEMVHMSPRHLLRTFREATGLTPIEYLLHRRIARATDLLRNETMNVTEVAFAVGFTDSNYFSRQFRTITGQTPTALRKATA